MENMSIRQNFNSDIPPIYFIFCFFFEIKNKKPSIYRKFNENHKKKLRISPRLQTEIYCKFINNPIILITMSNPRLNVKIINNLPLF